MSFWVVVPQYTMRKAQGGEPVAMFQVEVGCQSLSGQKTKRTVLRRYSHFQELASKLREELGAEKQLPPLPPKKALSRVNENDALLNQRRQALEQWLWFCLSDVEVAHSAALTSFLELAQARKGLQTGTSTSTSASSLDRLSLESPPATPAVLRSPSMVDSEAAESDGLSAREVTPLMPPPPRNPDAKQPGGHSAATRLALNENDRTSVRRMISALQQRYASAKSDLADALQCVRSDAAIKQLLASRVDELEQALAAQDAVRPSQSAGGGEGPPASGAPSEEERAIDNAWRLEESQAQIRRLETALGQEKEARIIAEQRVQQAESSTNVSPAAPVSQPPQPDPNEASERAALERKVLAREVKALRKDLAAAIAARDSAQEALSEAERMATQRGAVQAASAINAALVTFLREASALRARLADATVERLSTAGDAARNADPLELLAVSDNRISLLLAEAQLLGRGDGASGDSASTDVTLAVREACAELVTDNASLRLKINSLLRAALGMAQRGSIRQAEPGDKQQESRPRGPWPWGKQ